MLAHDVAGPTRGLCCTPPAAITLRPKPSSPSEPGVFKAP